MAHKHISTILFGIILLAIACGSPDNVFVNEVKTFEPRWMDLSETVAFIDRNLAVAERNYDTGYQTMKEKAKVGGANAIAEFNSLRSEFNDVIGKRDSIRTHYRKQKKAFTEAVMTFHEWENRLLKNRLDAAAAKQDFKAHKKKYRELEQTMEQLRSDITMNIERHNSVIKRMGRLLGVFSNFDIQVN